MPINGSLQDKEYIQKLMMTSAQFYLILIKLHNNNETLELTLDLKYLRDFVLSVTFAVFVSVGRLV